MPLNTLPEVNFKTTAGADIASTGTGPTGGYYNFEMNEWCGGCAAGTALTGKINGFKNPPNTIPP